MRQTLREIARQIAEDGDHNVGMLSREFHELIYGESVANHLLSGYDVGRAFASVSQRPFPKAQARANPCNPLLAAILSLDSDLHADCAARHHEEQLGFRSLADDDLALLEDQWPDDGFDQPIVLGAQPFEQVELGERKFRPGSLDEPANNGSSHHSSAASVSLKMHTARLSS